MTVSRIRNGVILLSVGVVLLLNNLDYVDWSVWVSILSLWPVLLIAIGIEKIFAKTPLSFLSYLSPVLLLLAILGPAYYYYNYEEKAAPSGKTFRWEKEMTLPVRKGYASIDFKAGRLKVDAGKDKLILANFDYWRREPLCIWRGWFKPGFMNRHEWDLFLSEKIPWDLKIENAAMSGDLNLSELILENLSIDSDASRLKIKLGDKAKNLKAKIDSDASKLELLIPKGVGLHIENRASLSSTDFEDISINHQKKIYWTSNYDSAPLKIDISLRGGISGLKVIGY